jgi:LmbE family N-acetylglucosaminyl deacetylase
MLSIDLATIKDTGLTVLCLGAHADDIEIGCGGTILKLAAEAVQPSFHWVVFSARGARVKEARTSAERFLERASTKTIVVKNYRDGFFPYSGGEIKEYFEELKAITSPDVIFTHYRHDLHQDHRLINELTWNTFRNHLILEYEIVKYDGDFGSPNAFVHVGEATAHEKVNAVYSSFVTQQDKPWFSKETLLSVLRLRGVESRSPSSFAEGFYCRKLIL